MSRSHRRIPIEHAKVIDGLLEYGYARLPPATAKTLAPHLAPIATIYRNTRKGSIAFKEMDFAVVKVTKRALLLDF